MNNATGSKTILSGGSSVKASKIAPQELHEICLDDSTELRPTDVSRPMCFKNILHEILFVLVCAYTAATFVFLQRSVVVIMDSLQQGLLMTPSELSWLSAGPGLTTGALFLPMAFIIEYLRPKSRKFIIIGSLLVYSLTVGISAASMNGIFLDVMCTLAGITCAFHIPTAMSMLSSVYPFPSRRKSFALAFFLAGSNPAAIMVGGIVSAAVTAHFAWRGTFVFLAVLFTLVSMLGLFVIPNLDRPENHSGSLGKDETSVNEAADTPPTGSTLGFRDVDWRGAMLLIMAVGLFSAALTSGPEAAQGWNTPYVWLLFAVGILSLGFFVYWERVAMNPLVPRVVWDKPELLVMLLFIFLISMSGCALVFWIPLFIETVQLKTPLETATNLLPQAVTGLCISPMIGPILNHVNSGIIATLSAFCMIGSNITLFYLRAGSNYWATTFPAIILSTLGMDWSLNVVAHGISSALPLQCHSAGLGLLMTVSRLAIPAGLAITTAIHSTFSERSDNVFPEVPYINVFYCTMSLSVLALTLVPFLQVDRSVSNGGRKSTSLLVNVDTSENRNHKDVAAVSAFSIQPRKSSLYPSQDLHPSTSAAGRKSATESNHDSPYAEFGPGSQGTGNKPTVTTLRSSAGADRVIWLVCEDCGSSKRMVEQVGDPVRYFYDDGNRGTPEQEAKYYSTSSGSTGTTVKRFGHPLSKDLNSFRG